AFLPAQTPWMAQMEPFLLQSASQFRPPPPPALTSPTYTADYREIQRVGGAASTVRTLAQTQIALFWTEQAAQQYNRAFRAQAADRLLSIEQTACYLALLDMTVADAGIACMDGKYAYGFWRPITAIQQGGDDGNPQTVGAPTWTPLAVTPNHPEYPSAHGCATSAVAATLTSFFGTRSIDFTIDSTVTGTTQHFASASALRRQIIGARIWAGLHFRNSMHAGITLGNRVARYAATHYFLPTG